MSFNESEWLRDNMKNILKNGIGRMSICTGCEGLVNPYSELLKCEIGLGCDECNGTGVVEADYADYPWFIKSEKLQKKVEILTKKVEILTKACEFYGDTDSWTNKNGGRKILITLEDVEHRYFTRCESSYVGGKTARQALKECKELG